jgi:hypothetical protein
MQFTDRDKVIITFIARHKFATVKQVSRYMEMGIKAAYRRLRKLSENYYLKYERIFHKKPGVYLITKKGIEASRCGVGTQNIALGTYRHDLQVTDLAVTFYQQGYEVITEKEILTNRKKTIGQTGRQERLPDLVISKNEEKIAIELEIAPKSSTRLKKIINYYARQRRYDQVWFYCQKDSVRQRIEELARKIKHIKVFSYEKG